MSIADVQTVELQANLQSAATNSTDAKPADELITPEEACALLSLTPATLRRRTIPEGVMPQLAAVGPHNAYRLVFTRVDLEKISSLEKVSNV